MKRHSGLTRTGTPSLNALPVVGSLLAGLVMALAFSISVVGCASDTNGSYPPGARGGQMLPPGPSVYEIITRLELEPEQLPAVRAVLEDAESERDEVFAAMQPGMGGRPDPSAMDSVRAKMAGLREQTEEQLAELLTSEQMDEYREMMQKAEREREQMRSEMGGRGGGRGGGRPPGGKG